jgi:hypothetical protein
VLWLVWRVTFVCTLQDPEVRRRELVAFLRAPLVAMCEKHAAKLMRSKFAGANVLLEVSIQHQHILVLHGSLFA